MNVRQEKYKANRIMGMTIVDAAKAAGYSYSYIRTKAYRIERGMEVGIKEELERAGLTAKVQAQALGQLLVAKKSQVCDIYVQKDENGKWKMNENMSSFIEVEDNRIRLDALKHIADLKGQVKSKIELPKGIGDTRIYIITKEANAGSKSNASRLPSEISI